MVMQTLGPSPLHRRCQPINNWRNFVSCIINQCWPNLGTSVHISLHKPSFDLQTWKLFSKALFYSGKTLFRVSYKNCLSVVVITTLIKWSLICDGHGPLNQNFRQNRFTKLSNLPCFDSQWIASMESNLIIYLYTYINYRKGSRLGHETVIDGMLKDGLWDVYNDFGMGVCAELCADQYSISREEQVLRLQPLLDINLSLHLHPLGLSNSTELC